VPDCVVRNLAISALDCDSIRRLFSQNKMPGFNCRVRIKRKARLDFFIGKLVAIGFNHPYLSVFSGGFISI
jgi:hypothetical protein